MYAVALAVWLAFLAGAVFYTRRARHPQARPLAAYLIFVMVFTASAFVLFAAATWILHASGRADSLSRPAGAALFLAVVFVPAFFLARWQLRKPPRPPTEP